MKFVNSKTGNERTNISPCDRLNAFQMSTQQPWIDIAWTHVRGYLCTIASSKANNLWFDANNCCVSEIVARKTCTLTNLSCRHHFCVKQNSRTTAARTRATTHLNIQTFWRILQTVAKSYAGPPKRNSHRNLNTRHFTTFDAPTLAKCCSDTCATLSVPTMPCTQSNANIKQTAANKTKNNFNHWAFEWNTSNFRKSKTHNMCKHHLNLILSRLVSNDFLKHHQSKPHADVC